MTNEPLNTQHKMPEKISSKAWLISLVLHALLLGILGVVTFSRGGHFGEGDFGVGISEIGRDDSSQVSGNKELTLEFAQTNIELSNLTIEEINLENIEPVITETLGDLQPSKAAQQAINANSNISSESWKEILSGSGGGGIGKNGASFFGIIDSGYKFVYIVDRSGSMNGERLSAAKRELLRSVRELNANCEFEIFFYNNSSVSLNGEELVSGTKKTLRNARRWIQQIQASGGTSPITTVKNAIDLNPDCIWILSDGEFSESIADEIIKLNKKNIRIHTIAFMNDSGVEQLRRIATSSRGKFRNVKAKH